jgi:hypothetical protein
MLNGDMREDPGEDEVIECLNSEENLSPVEVASPTQEEKVNPAHSKEFILNCSLTVVLSTVLVLQGPTTPPIFHSRPITTFRLLNTPKGESQSETRQGECYTPKYLLYFAKLFPQKLEDPIYVEIDIVVRYNGRKNKSQIMAKF